MRIVISSGHGKYIRGASGDPVPPQLDEVDEARRVVDRTATLLRSAGVDVTTYHDDVSDDQNENLNRIVDFHNSRTRDLDVSVHFNCYNHSAHGVEVLYVSQQQLAAKTAAAIAAAGPFTDRGAKKRTDLYFLNNTSEPAILLEICFCDHNGDANTYHDRFEVICTAIAETIGDVDVADLPPEEKPPTSPGRPDITLPRSFPLEDRPTIGRGDTGEHVEDLQRMLPRFKGDLDGDFGPMTEDATRAYQSSRGLEVDGICGQQTWTALYERKWPIQKNLPPPLTEQQIRDIREIASHSATVDYEWADRGYAPEGYLEGFALTWANTYRQLEADYAPAVDMARANTGDPDTDALERYETELKELNLDTSEDGPETLLALWTLMLGLGMRESSGQHCCGRDMNAENTASDTAEAGLFQTSYNAHNCSDHFDTLFDDFQAGAENDHPQGFLRVFEFDVSCDQSDWANYGSGDGAKFQDMCKRQPAFACETAATTLRHLCLHYGPIKRKEAEAISEAAEMLKAVRTYVDEKVPKAGRSTT